MKVSEMNARQKKAFYNIKYAARDLLGSLENVLNDYSENSEVYKRAKALLDNHNALVDELYYNSTRAVYYSDGVVWFSSYAKKFIRDINFCGKTWLMECCETVITKSGY